VTLWFQHHRVLSDTAVRHEGFVTRLETAGTAVWFYLWKALLPMNLTLVYPQLEMSWIPLALLALVLALCWRRSAAAFVALSGFVVMLFPMLGFFDQGFYAYSLVSDHWQYVAIPFVIATLVAAASRLPLRWLRWTCGALVGVVFFFAAALRAQLYGDDETLWRDAIARNSRAWVAHFNLGFTLRHQGHLAEAEQEYREALRLNPRYVEAHNNLGNLYVSTGRDTKAVPHFLVALQLNPRTAATHNNLGIALAHLRKYREAAESFREALKLDPAFDDARQNLAQALAALNEPPAR
jgi:tetratricopeptide (TPR) repeat protein